MPGEGREAGPGAFLTLESTGWEDYALLDTGGGMKLERFGSCKLARPEVQAVWRRAGDGQLWADVDATFIGSAEESGGHWKRATEINEPWKMSYDLNPHASRADERVVLQFRARTTQGRHLGVFPEGGANWQWLFGQIRDRISRGHTVNVLNLFGYTGLATLAAAAAGATVTHVDASRTSVDWARANQQLSDLGDRQIRWIVDDALKYVLREGRRGVKYDGIILDPPKFGRGPKGEVWELFRSLPRLLEACRATLSRMPVFALLTVYAVKFSAIHAAQALEEMVAGQAGSMQSGELVTREQAAGRLLSQAVFARWSADQSE